MIHFIVNKSSGSGNGEKVWRQTELILKGRNVSYQAYFTEYEGHASQIAADLSGPELTGEQTVIILGGDGSLNEVINGIDDFEKIRIGLIPTGSGNDFIRGLGLPKKPEKAIYNILNRIQEETESGQDKSRQIDLGQVTYLGGKRYFAISSGAGLDALVCKKTMESRLKKLLNRLHLGKLTYLLLTIQSLFTMESARTVIMTEDGKKRYSKMIFSAAMNLPFEGGGVPMAPKARPDDGSLTLSTAAGVPRLLTFFLLPFLVAGKHERIPGFHLTDFRKCKIRSNVPLVIHADGEYLGEFKELTYRCLPGKLKLIG